MILSAQNNSLTAPLEETRVLTPEERAIERFTISGNAIVTGGAGDIGIVACRALLEHGLEGLSIFDLASRFEGTKERIDVLREDFPSRKIVEEVVDVTKEEEIEKGVSRTVEQLGSVDILLCFAGILPLCDAETMTRQEWQTALDVNLRGTFLSGKYVARQMIEQQTGGSITFTTSVAATRAIHPFPISAYGVSKAGLLQLKSNLAAECARYGIRVNTISPGLFNTRLIDLQTDEGRAAIGTWKDRTPLGRMGEPIELVGTVVLLSSKAGRYITGAEIVVDGGALVF